MKYKIIIFDDVTYKSFQWNLSSFFNFTALHFAVDKKNIEIVALLLANQSIDISIQSISNYHII